MALPKAPRAIGAKTPNQPLGDQPDQHRCQEIALDPDIDQPCNAADCAVCVQCRQDQMARQAGGHAQAHRQSLAILNLAQATFKFGDPGEDLARFVEEQGPRDGGNRAGGVACDQPCAEFLFQGPQLYAQGGLGDVQFRRRARDAAGFANANEAFELSATHFCSPKVLTALDRSFRYRAAVSRSNIFSMAAKRRCLRRRRPGFPN
jgi:hypothetical protein